MQVKLNPDVVLDSRRAVWLPRQKTLVLADLFFGMGAARRRRPDPLPPPQQTEIWERVFSLIDDYAPAQIALLGDLKPSQGTVEGDEAEELRTIFRKLKGGGRQVVQVVGHPDRSVGPALEGLLDRLPPGERRVFVLRAYEGWSFDEIAGRAGGAASTARNQFQSARRRLAGWLAEKGVRP